MMQSVRMEKSLCDIQPETISDFTQKNVKRIKQDRGPSPARGFSKELTREKAGKLDIFTMFFLHRNLISCVHVSRASKTIAHRSDVNTKQSKLENRHCAVCAYQKRPF